MNPIFFLLLSPLLIYPFKMILAQNFGNDTDREALLNFRAKITSDPSQFLNSWNESLHVCQWSGVICNNQSLRVIALSIPDQKLSGSLSPYLGNMSFMRGINLPNNSFNGEIPPQLGRLQRLEILYLHYNSLSGDIPVNISACTNLRNIALGRNNLQGKIPVELGSLSKLEFLSFIDNHVTGGIPLSFGNLSSLGALEASNNNLFGSIPSVMGQLKNLTRILLSSNNLSGIIPSSIYNLSLLTSFDLGFNQIHGSLPPDMDITLPNLEFFSVSGNNFRGMLPISISNLSNLRFFEASSNQLTGKMPIFYKLQKLEKFVISSNHLGSGQANDMNFISSLSNATDLRVLAVDNNNLGGTLPESLGNLSTKLSAFYLGRNQISGNFPTGIGNLVNLEQLILWDNNFTGNIPPGIWKLQNLRKLDLGINKFSGYISPSVGNLSLLLEFRVYKNDLQGAIPFSIGICKKLLGLDLSCNNFNDTIPNQVLHLRLLYKWLDLSENQLTGSLPTEIGILKNLGTLDVSNNMLSGGIPTSLGSCVSMEYLYMGGNSFQGNIPSSFSSLRGIQVLALSPNNLSGKIPDFLGSLDFKFLNVSFNDFEGALPIEGVFKNSSLFSVKGNSRLCGGLPELKLPLCPAKRPKNREPALSVKLIIPLILGLVGLTSATGILLCCWLRRKGKRKQPLSSIPGYSSLMRISFQSLVNATCSFNSVNLIGRGSFGTVYRGVLEDGKAIAVKVLDLQRHGALKSFMAECEALRNIRHRNLVGVLSACSSVDNERNDFKAVVYELMVNGSLEEWLHSSPEPNRQFLNLFQRLNIAIDVACALDYLHNQCQTPVVHYDIKPSNVLLDNEMTAHVGDFGLARLLLEETNSFTASHDRSSSLAIKGTVGYIPPEYGMGSEVCVDGDIYSYGILVLEMITGKRPTGDIFNDSLNLHSFSKLGVSEGLAGIVDPKLLQPAGEDGEASMSSNSSSKKVEECLTSILKIGVGCSMESPGERMSINSVFAELQVIRNRLLRTMS